VATLTSCFQRKIYGCEAGDNRLAVNLAAFASGKPKRTAKPTAERILKAFADVSLTIIKQAAGEEILRRLTPLSAVQEAILQRLGLGAALYRQFEIQEMGN
jgi:hypothetical protein